MKLLLTITLAAALFSGCSATTEKYSPGENFGNSGETRCGYQTTVKADLKPCR